VPPVRAMAVSHFAMGVRSRRDVLQTLFYATTNSAAPSTRRESVSLQHPMTARVLPSAAWLRRSLR
jgi:hypothetical protein